MLSNLHHKPYYYRISDAKVIEVKVGLLPIAPIQPETEKQRSPWDMRDSIPHILIKTIASKTKNPKTLIDLMSQPIPSIEKKDAKPLPTNYTEYKVRINFATVKRYFIDSLFIHPNTRLEFLNTRISIPYQSGLAFYNIDKLENEFEEIDFGNLSRENSVTFNAKLTGTGELGSSVDGTVNNSTVASQSNKNSEEKPVYDEKGNVVGKINNAGEFSLIKNNGNTVINKSAAKVTANAEVGYLNTENIKEAIAIKMKRMKTGFAFSPYEITISQGGRPNGDISHNVYVTTTLRTTVDNTTSRYVYAFANLFNENNQPTNPDNLIFTKRTVSYSSCTGATPIELPVEFEGALRVVGNSKQQSGENALENDDRVTYYHLTTRSAPSIYIQPGMYCKEVYKIIARDRQGYKYDLRIRWTSDDEVDLFSDDKPEQFLQWLIMQVTHPTRINLNTNKFELYFEGGRPASKIYIAKNNLTEADIAAIKTLNGITSEVRAARVPVLNLVPLLIIIN